ncbi:uncharacterized protein [Euwallacea fornicatus]|uniref:uncharacterized protein isoform X2 n=1 Tax=Euwallacea fornicatus TaxID=995702 RepID=UPI00338DBCE5
MLDATGRRNAPLSRNMSLEKYLTSLFFMLTLLTMVPTKGEGLANICLNINDILSLNFMPGTLLERIGTDFIESNETTLTNDINKPGMVLDGSFKNALQTMNFHRSMMNQYLCRNYMANQIVSDITNRTTFKRRMSNVDGETMNQASVETENLQKNFLLDQGSLTYQEWLRKHYSQMDEEPIKKSDEDADVTKTLNTNQADRDFHGISYDPADYIINHEGVLPHFSYPPQHSIIDKKFSKDEKLADVFEVALTALAYLSFGIFIVHLIMSISAVRNPQMTTLNSRIVVVYPRSPALYHSYESDESSPGSSFTTEEYINSYEEDPQPRTSSDSSVANELAKRLLTILDSALIAARDKGRCFKRAICSAAKYSRDLHGNSKLFMGFLSFGASWLSDKISEKALAKSEGLQAAILGLGDASCDMIYVCGGF